MRTDCAAPAPAADRPSWGRPTVAPFFVQAKEIGKRVAVANIVVDDLVPDRHQQRAGDGARSRGRETMTSALDRRRARVPMP